jgi:phosphoglycolate phosphatase
MPAYPMEPSQNTIIWDWNGTLLDDLDICLQSINSMLDIRHLPKLSSERYQHIFTFPVIEYYRVAGFDFDKENWEKVAMEFMDSYFNKLSLCPLFPDAIQTLDFFNARGYRQIILSAMEQNALTASVNERGIGRYFQKIAGIDNHYAAGKSGNGHTLINELGLSTESTWFIGDTLHDADIARELGCRCLLIANGHQAKERLAEAGVPVLQSLTALQSFFTI